MLQSARYAVKLSVLAEACPRLLEPEGDTLLRALRGKIGEPVEIAFARFRSAFAAGNNQLYPRKIGLYAHPFEQRLANDHFVLDRQNGKQRKPLRGAHTVFAGAAEGDVFPPVAPITWDAIVKACYTFCILVLGGQYYD